MGEGKLVGFVAGVILGAVIGGSIVYLILTLQAIQRAQAAIQTSSVLFDKDAQGRTTAIHYTRGPQK